MLDKDITYHIICQSGARSGQACLFLEAQGYNVVNIAGGTSAWPGVEYKSHIKRALKTKARFGFML